MVCEFPLVWTFCWIAIPEEQFESSNSFKSDDDFSLNESIHQEEMQKPSESEITYSEDEPKALSFANKFTKNQEAKNAA